MSRVSNCLRSLLFNSQRTKTNGRNNEYIEMANQNGTVLKAFHITYTLSLTKKSL